ncbi:MAG: hypothetical protein IJ308_06105 [Clostridia bacterium]|nr:hypothetical protein [Clostridia bacterium]
MKKYLIAFLLSLSCGFAFAAVGCGENNTGNSSDGGSSDIVYTGESTVTFVGGEGFEYITQTESGAEIKNGEYVEFQIDLGGFYLDSSPVVYVNDMPIAHDDSGNYRVLVTQDATIRVENVKKDVSQIDSTGLGTMDSPFVVSKPIDLIYIADKVNSGVQSYVQGAYILAADIDCKGEELKVIGDSSTENAYFSGCFVCNYNSETGEVYDYSISNFKIKSRTANYVGLFGTVYADLSVSSSGLFYGINLENFTIEASLTDEHMGDSKTITCGSLIGYGVGATLYQCSATNGNVNLTANEYYFSYVGGLIGYQQAFYSPDFDYHFPSEIAYSHTDVNIRAFEGKVLGAGGIVGYMTTNYPSVSVASVHNSYALGDISGAMRSGGIAGTMGRYSVVSNCYASGMIYASCNLALGDEDWPNEYKVASAGGLVGYAENDTIAHDCFFNGETGANAAAGEDFTFTSPHVAFGDPAGYASVTAQKYIARDENCLSTVDLSNVNYLPETLGWGAHDWNFFANELPLINYSVTSSGFSFAFTLKYVDTDGNPFDIKGVTESEIVYFDSLRQDPYLSFGSFLENGVVPKYYDYDTTENGYRTFGYFFDKECTQRVPNGYMPMRNVTLYVGFAKIEPIIGTYYFETGNYDTPLSIEFKENGLVRYSDGLTYQEAYYYYDGEYVYIEGARFARYYNGEVVIKNETDDPNFDLDRYMYYDFCGVLTDSGLQLYDNIYFTSEAPFTASATEITPEQFDGFKGEWTKLANVNKTYTFDGKGNWTYTHTEYERTGNYFGSYATPTVIDQANGAYELADDETLRFTHNGVTYTATFNQASFMEISDGATVQTYYDGASYVGTWTTGNLTLTLQGIPENGTGTAVLTQGEVASTFVYEKAETENYLVLYYPHDAYVKNDLFGYFYYDVHAHTLVATLYDANNLDTGYSQYAFRALDEYYGEWITDVPALKNAELIFDGNGLYAHAGQVGKLTVIDGENTTEIEYTLNSLLEGAFVYNGVTYNLSYDENTGNVRVSAENELQRKDELAGYVFLDENGNNYVFNGKGNLSQAVGTVTVNGNATYTYKQINDGSGNLSHFEITAQNGDKYTLAKTETHYAWTDGQGASTPLYIQNEFMGEWAMSEKFDTLTIGATQLDGVIRGKFYGKDVQLTEYDAGVLTFDYMEGRQPHTYYLFIVFDETVGENVLVLTEYNNLYGDDWVICTKTSEYFGTWVWNKNNAMSITFDGVHTAYQNGAAWLTYNNSVTLYYYSHMDDGLFMWSSEAMADRYWYYTIRLLTADDEGFEEAKADVNSWYNAQNDTVIIREEVDTLCFVEAKDSEGNDYYFDGKGNILVNGEVKYTYEIDAQNANDTYDLIVCDVATNKTYYATLDCSKTDDEENNLFLLGEEIAEDDTSEN